MVCLTQPLQTTTKLLSLNLVICSLSRRKADVTGCIEGGDGRHKVVQSWERNKVHSDLIQVHIEGTLKVGGTGGEGGGKVGRWEGRKKGFFAKDALNSPR